ncbi:MAG TPA: LCP family protein [Candidatus Saccharimonadia bacterium]|nr:LCP family protein [Candidatus Saccharimonadia bacterium]
MSHQFSSGRRSLDGPVRRVATPSVAPSAELLPRTSGSPSMAPKTGPVFAYRKPKRRLRLRRALLGLAALAVVTLGWFGYKTLAAAHKIIARSDGVAPALAAHNGAVNLAQLKGEGDGRVNILMLGIGGAGHDGPNLSDTMMVVSIDPKTKDVAMLSIPRDLYVKLPATAKTSAQYGKINSANAFGGPELAKQVVQNVIGVPIHYYIVVDFSGFKQAVDAVGGVDVNVAQALYDPAFPCDNDRGGYCPLSIKAGPQHMDGTIALRYARCRHDACGGDLARAARQQQVLVAVRQKALQLSTLTNPIKLTGLIDAVGDHLKTDLQPAELQKLASIAKDVDPAKITNKVLDYGKADSLLIDGSGSIPGAGSIELPKAGTFDYSDIHDFVKNIFIDHYIVDEKAVVAVENGSGITGLAGKVVTSLQAAHYNVLDPMNAADHYPQTVIYDYTGGKKPYTINYLEQRFGVKSQRVAAPSPSPAASPAPTPEIRIILGSDYGTNIGSAGSQ